jgi:hypothetical protein
VLTRQRREIAEDRLHDTGHIGNDINFHRLAIGQVQLRPKCVGNRVLDAVKFKRNDATVALADDPVLRCSRCAARSIESPDDDFILERLAFVHTRLRNFAEASTVFSHDYSAHASRQMNRVDS